MTLLTNATIDKLAVQSAEELLRVLNDDNLFLSMALDTGEIEINTLEEWDQKGLKAWRLYLHEMTATGVPLIMNRTHFTELGEMLWTVDASVSSVMFADAKKQQGLANVADNDLTDAEIALIEKAARLQQKDACLVCFRHNDFEPITVGDDIEELERECRATICDALATLQENAA